MDKQALKTSLDNCLHQKTRKMQQMTTLDNRKGLKRDKGVDAKWQAAPGYWSSSDNISVNDS